MKKSIRIIAMAMSAIVMLAAACGNADAKKDGKKKLRLFLRRVISLCVVC